MVVSWEMGLYCPRRTPRERATGCGVACPHGMAQWEGLVVWDRVRVEANTCAQVVNRRSRSLRTV